MPETAWLASEYIGQIVSVRSTVPREVKVEISGAWVVGCIVGRRNKKRGSVLGYIQRRNGWMVGRIGGKTGGKTA